MITTSAPLSLLSLLGGGTEVLRVVLALLPISLFLASLVWLDSYKLVRLRSVLRMIAAGGLAAAASWMINGAVGGTEIGDDALRRELWSAGAQVDFSMVLFSTLESMFSVGYGRAFDHGSTSGELMISLKLLR